MRASNRSIRALSAFVLVMAPLAFVEPAATAEGAGGVVGQDTVVVYRGEVGRHGAATRSQVQVPVTVSSFRGATKPSQPVPPAPPATPLDKLDPELAKAVSQPAAANSRQRVLITFQQDLKVPRLPDLNPDLPRTAAANVQIRAQADSMIADLTAQRTSGYQAISADLAKVGARTLNTFWLIKAMEVDALPQRCSAWPSAPTSRTSSPWPPGWRRRTLHRQRRGLRAVGPAVRHVLQPRADPWVHRHPGHRCSKHAHDVQQPAEAVDPEGPGTSGSTEPQDAGRVATAPRPPRSSPETRTSAKACAASPESPSTVSRSTKPRAR